MLLRDLRNRVQYANTLQLVLAISVGLNGSYETTKGIISSSTKNLEEYVKSAKEQNPGIDELSAVITYFMEYNILSVRTSGRRFVNAKLNDSLRAEGLPALSFEKHYDSCIQILQNYAYNDLTYLFLSTTYATRDMRKVITKEITKHYGSMSATTTAVDAVYKDFCKFFYNSSRQSLVFQDNMTTDLLGFYVKTLEFYAKGSNAYTLYVNETDQDAVIQGGDFSTSALDLYAVENKSHSVDIDFQDIANRIAAASCLLYGHSSQQVAMYDIYTKYNSRQVNTIVNNLRSSFQNLLPYIRIENNWDNIDTTQSHVRNKKNNRDNTAEALFVLAERPVRIEELNKLYNAARKADDADAFNKEQGKQLAKDGLYIFSTIGHKVKSKLSNSEKFQILVEGFNALRELREYLTDNDIDPLSIPVDIFRDMNLPRRYFSLEGYLNLHYVTSSLIEEEKSRNSDLKGAYHNDEIYDTFVMGCFDQGNRLIEFLRKSAKLGDIKTAVERYGTCINKNEYISSKAYATFQLTHPIIEPLKVLVKEHLNVAEMKITYEGKILDVNNPEQMRNAQVLEKVTANFYEVVKANLSKCSPEYLQSFKAPQNGLPICERYSIVNLHFTEENITTWLTDNPPNTSIAENRKIVAEKYNKCEGADCLIAEGGLFENTPARVLMKYNAIEDVINSDSFDSLDRETQEKAIFVLTNTLELVMAEEGHPVSKGKFYNLSAPTLEEEFSYLNNEARIQKRCSALKKAFRILCNSEYQNEFEMLNFLFIISRMLQYYAFTNRRIIGKARNLYNGVTPPTMNSVSLDPKAVDDFINDGDFAVLIRAGVFIGYLDKAKETGDFASLPLDRFTNNYYVNFDCKYDSKGMLNRMKLLLINVSNSYIRQHDDIYEFLGQLAKYVHRYFDYTCKNLTIIESPEILAKLEVGAIQAREFATQNLSTAMRKTMLKITANAICDSNGYIMNYGRLFKNQEGEYLHCSGVWVKLPNNESYSVTLRPFNDFKQFEGVLNFIYD